MVTEVVEIVIRERGAAATTASIKGIGTSSLSATKAVSGLLTALGAFAAVRGLKNLAESAVDASAEFEQFGVRLKAFLGNQQEANAALESFVTLGAKTPFAVKDIVEGSAALASVALGNRQKLEELTQTAANLAAVTGISFQDAASNLARSLSAGIGAADQFREKGVTRLIEAITGIPDATKLSAAELDAAFQQVFGKTGQFGAAAEQLSLTLGGALSNIGDSADRFKVALGEALSPVVINAANEIFIPFFQQLTQTVKDNEGSIRAFVANGVTFLVQGFVTAGQAGLALIQTFQTVRNFVREIIGTFLQFHQSIIEIDNAILSFTNSVGITSNDALAAHTKRLNDARAATDAWAESDFKADAANEQLNQSLDGINSQLGKLQDFTNKADFGKTIQKAATPDTSAALRAAGEAAANRLSAEQIQAQESAAAELLKISRDLSVERAAQEDPLARQLIAIDEQIARVTELARITGDEAEGQRLINQLIEERGKIQAGTGIAAQLGASVSGAVQQGLVAGVSGSNIGEAMSKVFEQSANDSLTKGLDKSIAKLGPALQETFKSVGEKLPEFLKIDGLSGAFGTALSGALAFVAQQGLAALFGGGGNSQNSSNGNARSAVTSTQAVRGIVAGPQEIAIAQVGDNLQDAVAPLLEETVAQTAVLRQIRQLLTGTPAAFSTATAASEDLALSGTVA